MLKSSLLSMLYVPLVSASRYTDYAIPAPLMDVKKGKSRISSTGGGMWLSCKLKLCQTMEC
jgi:hypothetical protein